MQYDTDADFHACIAELIDTAEVQQMCHIPQHGQISCFGHSVLVAYLSYRICRKWELDWRAAARGGLLHDLFLYDWHIHGTHEGLHAFSHPRAACSNANRICALTDREQDIILSHMWPVTFRHFYRYPESAVVSCVDKLCAVAEAFHVFHHMRLAHRLGLSQRVFLQRGNSLFDP